MKLSVEEIATALHADVIVPAGQGGQAPDPAVPSAGGAPVPFVTGMTWDSREVKPGDLYVALPGERVDGHDFAQGAARDGAAAILAQRPVQADTSVIVVDDTARALTELAAYWRGKLEGMVIGLTGSSGKTTTKNLVRDVLAAHGSVVATLANQNNELGVPRTLLAADADTAAVVVEMGMRGLGQIHELCAFARPDWGLITNVGESHIELLGSRENIAHAKAELLADLPDKRGLAFVNAADDYAVEVCKFARLAERGVRAVFFDGTGERLQADLLGIYANGDPFVWAGDIAFDGEGRPTFTLNVENFENIGRPDANGAVSCTLQLRGIHNVSNACSAAAVGLAAGMSPEAVRDALANAQPEQGRQRVLRTASGITVVDDAYNANPDSMKASLSMFAEMDVAGKRIAVLGDMGELGDFAPECHERVGVMAAHAHLDYLICAGELSRNIARVAQDEGMPASCVACCDDGAAALALVKDIARPGDAVLVKASHFMQFEKIVEGLAE